MEIQSLIVLPLWPVLLIAEQTFGGRPDDRKHAIAVYNDHVDEVIATVPEHRLLIQKKKHTLVSNPEL